MAARLKRLQKAGLAAELGHVCVAEGAETPLASGAHAPLQERSGEGREGVGCSQSSWGPSLPVAAGGAVLRSRGKDLFWKQGWKCTNAHLWLRNPSAPGPPWSFGSLRGQGLLSGTP